MHGCAFPENENLLHFAACDVAEREAIVGVDPEDRRCLDKMSDEGDCKDFSTRFYFDYFAETCKSFVWGGCGGSRNNFGTKEECAKGNLADLRETLNRELRISIHQHAAGGRIERLFDREKSSNKK